MPFHWYTDVLKRYAVFDGRAGRPEFWWFTLFSFIVAVAIGLVVEIAVGGGAGQAALYLYLLAVALPSLGVSIRRLHDTNRSGWWVLIGCPADRGNLAARADGAYGRRVQEPLRGSP